GLIPVMEQFTPDGRFPTVGFPNPEEEGALDLAVAAARRADADLVIANDPDADRLAAVLPRGGEWYPLSGNDLGCLLGDFVMENWSGDTTQIVVSSIVSSPMLSRLAALRGARHELSLTGFKWIVNAGLSLEAAGEGTFTFGYEEALGYTIGQVVRDKDGMSAALVLCDLVENLRLQGRTLWDRLISLWSSVGIWASAQRSVASRAEETPGLVDNLANNPPAEIAGLSVEHVIDYRVGEESRPPWLGAQDLVELSLGGAGRALARPSGTEPKVKIYVDLSEPMGEDPLAAQITLAKRAGVAAETLGGYLTR
ncbi:MAG: phospho-sugar mutase, partial [Actinobacteria bacterium]|nr:phospho-sugar mutase [Actinomycetota bacterium]